jgi:hypothetical protein
MTIREQLGIDPDPVVSAMTKEMQAVREIAGLLGCKATLVDILHNVRRLVQGQGPPQAQSRAQVP